MASHVLVTGGMGFIGRYVVSELLERGDRVRVLDNFNEQVHADASLSVQTNARSDYEIIDGDIRDRAVVGRSLKGIDRVVHLAAEVGVGQSMYEITRYVGVNELGTATLLQQMTRQPVERIVVASSMSVYGEGLYCDDDGRPIQTCRHFAGNGSSHSAGWDPVAEDGRPLTPVPTPEWKQPKLTSIYALNKYAQEQMALIVPPAYGTEAVALRLFNVYGPGQALSNPYTGVLAVFAARLLNGNSPTIFEDGRQLRDFVNVRDVARAFAEALTAPNVAGEVINIGSGQPVAIGVLAKELADAMGCQGLGPEITGKLRAGDVRHCFADISKAEEVLRYEPQCSLSAGLAELADWVRTQNPKDNVAFASAELEERGLVT